MRGGISYNELLHEVPLKDYELINELIEENMTLTKETKLPFI